MGKTEILKRETEKLKFRETEAQLKKFNDEMDKVAKKQANLEHQIFKNSLIRKANDDLLQSTYDIRISNPKVFSAKKIEELENKININGANLQALHYQNTKNELLLRTQWSYLVQ
jgi:hypothetical protein